MDTQLTFADNKGVKIHYIAQYTDLPNTPLIMIPGMTNSAEEIIDDLGDSLPYPTIHISLRGRGHSDSPDSGYTLADQASDIGAVVEHLGLSSFYLCGHSAGGTIATVYAATVPDRVQGLVICDFPPFYPPYSSNWVAQVLEHLYETPMTEKALDGIATDAEYTDVVDKLNSLQCPILVLHGGQEDTLLQPEEVTMIQKLVPNTIAVLLPESGHDLLRPIPQPFAEQLLQFMKADKTV